MKSDLMLDLLFFIHPKSSEQIGGKLFGILFVTSRNVDCGSILET